jgi:hypothetical protein
MAVASVYSESERATSSAPSEAHPASAIVIANKMIYSKFLMSTLLFFLGAKVQKSGFSGTKNISFGKILAEREKGRILK